MANAVSAPELEHRIARIGGLCAVLGGLGYLASTSWHGDMPDATTEIALRHIAGLNLWLTLIGVLMWRRGGKGHLERRVT